MTTAVARPLGRDRHPYGPPCTVPPVRTLVRLRRPLAADTDRPTSSPHRAWAVVVAALALLAVACGGSDSGSSSAAPSTTAPSPSTSESGGAGGGGGAPRVEMQRSRFMPEEVVISVGETVEFVNLDPFAHTVTSEESSAEQFDSGNLGEGETFTYRFDQPGTFPFFCRIHPTMQARVVVR